MCLERVEFGASISHIPQGDSLQIHRDATFSLSSFFFFSFFSPSISRLSTHLVARRSTEDKLIGWTENYSIDLGAMCVLYSSLGCVGPLSSVPSGE